MVSGLLSRLTAAIGVGWIEADGASPVGVSVVNYLSAPLLGDNPLRGRSLFSLTRIGCPEGATSRSGWVWVPVHTYRVTTCRRR